MARKTIAVYLTEDEKAQLDAEAAEAGISTSLLAYRRMFNNPEAPPRPVGRRPKHQSDADPNQGRLQYAS